MAQRARRQREARGQVFREHLSSPDCWCRPYEDSPGLWVHRLDPDVEGYVPDIKGAIEGDDGVK